LCLKREAEIGRRGTMFGGSTYLKKNIWRQQSSLPGPVPVENIHPEDTGILR